MRSPPRPSPNSPQQLNHPSIGWLNSQKIHHNPDDSHAITILRVQTEGNEQDVCVVNDGNREQTSIGLCPHPDPMIEFMAMCVNVIRRGIFPVCRLQMCQQFVVDSLNWLNEFVAAPPQ
jgi:hypothetical protein